MQQITALFETVVYCMIQNGLIIIYLNEVYHTNRYKTQREENLELFQVHFCLFWINFFYIVCVKTKDVINFTQKVSHEEFLYDLHLIWVWSNKLKLFLSFKNLLWRYQEITFHHHIRIQVQLLHAQLNKWSNIVIRTEGFPVSVAGEQLIFLFDL